MTLAGAGKSGEREQRWEDEDVDLTASGSAGEDLVVELRLDSAECQEHWQYALFRGDVPMPSERYQVETRGNVVQLTLKQSQKEDSGHYALVAKKLSSGLSISGDERAESRHRIRLSIQDPSSIIEEGEPPIFLRRPSDLAVKVGTRTRFLVEIRSSTSPKVTWHKNDEPLQSGSRFSFVHEGNFYCVDVAPVMVDDQGHWTCMAENESGRSSCTSFLSVIVPKAYKKPEFVEELRAILTETGTVSLECKVVGVPTPVLKWFKDQKEIKAGDVFALTANPDDPTSLGTYTCEAVNCMGTAYSSSRVHVMGKGSREGSLKPADALRPSGPLPVFRQILRDESCRIGDTLVLACQVNVPPWPKDVTWYNKEGRVEPSEKYNLRADGLGGYSIEVKGVEATDAGEWKCVATSIENVKQFSECHVAMAIPKNYRMPRFMESLKAVLTEEGLVSFECKVVGFPTPLLRWFKDGQELHPGDVYQLTGTNSLGSYCCIARNCMGEARSVAELTVEDIQNQLNEEERMQLVSSNQAPKFVKGLRSCEARINEDFTFTIKVSVSPEPILSWYRDDVAIIESERYRLAREALGTCNLEVKRLEFVDQAEWKCVAANDFGHSVTSCFLKLVIPKHFKKPRFLESLRAILSEEGAVNLECKVIGVPQPILKWYKDGIELKPGDIHRIISGQDGTCCLGTYTCEATNCMGSVSSSASLLGFEDRVSVRKEEAKEPVTPLHELARNLSLSTIHEERTSQLYDTPQTDHSITMDDRGEVSFSFDGKEVSVSLYETPDLTEEEALQIVEMYADQLSEHITEGNVIELPPMRFTKETSTTGNLLMEAVVIDVSPDYFIPDEEGDDLRTEADVEDVSIMDDQMQSVRSSSCVTSPTGAESSGVASGSPPSRPPRRKESRESFSSRSERSDKSLAKAFDWSESYHSAREPSMQAQSLAQAQDDSGEAFTDALSSSARSKAEESRDAYASLVQQNIERIALDETMAEVSKRDLSVEGEASATRIARALVEQVPLKKKRRKRKSRSGKAASRTSSLSSSKASSEESFSPDVEEATGKRRASANDEEGRGSLAGSDKSGKDRGSGSESGNFETAAPSPDLRRRESDATIMVDDVRIEQIEDVACVEPIDENETPRSWQSERPEAREPTAESPELVTSESERASLKSNKKRVLESVDKLSEPIMSLRSALVDLDDLLPLLQIQGSPAEDDRSRMEIEARIVHPVENLCEQVSAIESKALKSAGDRSLAQNVRISLLEVIGGPTEELLRGIELIRRHSGQQDPKSSLIVLESLTDPVDEILASLTRVKKDLCSGEAGEYASIQTERPIALERMSRAVSRLGKCVEVMSERKLALGDEATSLSVIERLQSVYQSLEAFVSSVPLSETSGPLENNVDTLVVESLVRPLEELSRKLVDSFGDPTLRTPDERDILVANLETSTIEMRTRLEALTVALETYERESGEQGITELHADLVKFLKYTMDDASERLAKLKTKRIRVSQESQARKESPGLEKRDDDESAIESSEPEETNVLQELAEETAEIMKSVSVPTIARIELAERDARMLESPNSVPTIDEKSSPVSEQVSPTKTEKPSSSTSDEPVRKKTERVPSPDETTRKLPVIDTDLSLPEMLLDPLIDVQANLSDVISDFESQESAEESSLPGNSELAACLTELRESVATAAHTATSLKSADTVDALVDLREPLLDLQLAMTSVVSPAEIKLIREATAPLSELKVILAAVIGSPQSSEASQVQMKSILRMLEDIEAEVTKISGPEEAPPPAVIAETPEIKAVPTRPPEEVERAAIALTGVHFALSSVLERATSFPIESEDLRDPEREESWKVMAERTGRSNLIFNIEELRQSVGNLAVAIGTPVVLPANNDRYSYEIVFEELAKLEEPLLNLQRVLLTEQHDPEDRHLLNDLAAPIRSLKEIVQNVTSETAVATAPAVLELIEDVEKDVTLIAMEALKRALATKSETAEGYDKDPRASISSSSKPGELPGFISSWLDPIEDWLTSSAEETTETDERPGQTDLAPVIDDLKRELLKIAIRSSYSEPPSDAALVESLTELSEPLARVYQALAVCHSPENLEIVEGLVQPAKHLMGTILDASVVHEAGKVLRPVLEAIEELENQIPLTIKRIVYDRELQRVVRSMTPDETLMAEDIAQAHENIGGPAKSSAQPLEKVAIGVNVVHVGMEEGVGYIRQDSTTLEEMDRAKMKSSENVAQSSKATIEMDGSVQLEEAKRFSPEYAVEEQARMETTECKPRDGKSEERADTIQIREAKTPESTKSEAEASSRAPDSKEDIPQRESAPAMREELEESSEAERKKIGSSPDEKGRDSAASEQEKIAAVADLENSQSETVEVITVDSRPLMGATSPLKSGRSSEASDTTRADELDLWTLTLLGPLDRLGNAVISLDRSIDELAHGLLCRPLDSLHKQIEIAESQFNRPVGQSLENDVETIIEGFLSPVNQLHSALGAAVSVWNDEQPRIVVRDLLRSIADSSSELCELLDTLRNKLTVRRAEQTLQEQQEDASLVETINAVVAPLEDVKNLIEDALRSLEFVDSSGEIEPSEHREKSEREDETIPESLDASAQPSAEEPSLGGLESPKTSVDRANVKSEDTSPTGDTLLRGEEDSGKSANGEAVEPSPREKVFQAAAHLTRAPKVKEDSMDIEETTAKPLEELIEAIVDSSIPRPVSSSPETHRSLTPEVPEEHADTRQILSAEEEIAAGFESTEDIRGEASIQGARILPGEDLATTKILADAAIVAENRENLAESTFTQVAAETLREIEAEREIQDRANIVGGDNLSRIEIIAGPEISAAAGQAVTEILAKATDLREISEKGTEPTRVQRTSQAKEIEDKIQEETLEATKTDYARLEKATVLSEENLAMTGVKEQKSFILEAPAVSQEHVHEEGVTEIPTKTVTSESGELRQVESLAKVAIAETPELRIQPNNAKSSELGLETADVLEVTYPEKVHEERAEVYEGELLPKADIADTPELFIKGNVAESTQLEIVDESVHDATGEKMDLLKAQVREGESLAETAITVAPELRVKPAEAPSLELEIAEESTREISIEKIEPLQAKLAASEALDKAEITNASETRLREQTADVTEESVRELLVEKSEEERAEIGAGESLLEAMVTGTAETKIRATDLGVSQSPPEVTEESVGEIPSQESKKRKAELREESSSLDRAGTDVAETREAEEVAKVGEVVQELAEERSTTFEDRRCAAQIAIIEATEVAKMSEELVVKAAESAIVEIVETPTEKMFKLKREGTGEGETAEIVEKIVVKPVEEVVSMEDRNIVEIVETPSEKVIKVRIPVAGKDTALEEVIEEIVVKKPVQGWAKSLVEEEERAVSASEAKVQEFVASSISSDVLRETMEIVPKHADEVEKKEGEEKLETSTGDRMKSLAEKKKGAERSKLEESESLKREEEEARKAEAKRTGREEITRQEKIKEEENLKREEAERAEQEREEKERKVEAERIGKEDVERHEKAEAETQRLRKEEEEKLREETARLEPERQSEKERERREREEQEAERVRKEEEEAAKLRKEEAEKLRKNQAEKEKEAEELRKEEVERLEKEESERRKQEAERAQKEAAEKLEKEESERKAQEAEKARKEEAERLKREESRKRQEEENLKKEEERREREEAEKLEREQQEAERLKQEQLERAKKEEEERRQKEEAERLKQEKLEREKREAERLKQEQLERAKKEEEERRQKEEAERLKQEKLEREKCEAERLKQKELERAKMEEEERLKKEEAEKLEREQLERTRREEERLKKEEAERLEKEKQERAKKEEEERLKREEAEKLEREKLERAKREEEERIQKEEAEKLEKEKLERAKREEEERLKREGAEKLEREKLESAKIEEERLKKEEAERLEKEKQEWAQKEEEERLKREEAEKLEREKLEREKKKEEERIQKEEAEKLEKEKLERAKKEEEERLKKEEVERLEREKLERARKEEEERIKTAEKEKLEKEKLERAKKEEEERIKKAEVENQEKEKLERAKKEEAERLKREEAEKLELERLERAKKEEEERIKKAEAEKLEKENLERMKREEEERLKREEEERLKREGEERLKREEEERLKREEAARLDREKLERVKKEEEERLAREEAERLEKEKVESAKKQEEERLKKEEAEKLAQEKLERMKKEEEERLKKEKLEKEKQERAKKEEQLEREEAERLEAEKLERAKKEEERLKREEEEARLKKEENERLKREEEEARLKKEENERRKREEDEQLKREEEEARLKKEENERLKREEDEARLKKEENERLKREEDERLKREEDERLKREEETRLKREEEEERLKREEEECLKREERLKREEEERLKREETEKLENDKLERARKEKEQQLKRDEAEILVKEKLERAKKEEEERLKREEAGKIERKKLDRAKKEEEERIKREQAERLEKEKLEQEKQEGERLKREESERVKEKEERLRKEQAEKLEKEKLERDRKEEEERLEREKREELEHEKREDERKKQEELSKKEELAKLEKEKLEREEAERRKREEEEELEKEKHAKEAKVAESRKKEEAEKLAEGKEVAEKQKKKEHNGAERQKIQEPEVEPKKTETEDLEKSNDHRNETTEQLKKELQQNEEKKQSTSEQETETLRGKEKDTKRKSKDDTKRSKKEDSKEESRPSSKKEDSEQASRRGSKKEESKQRSSPRVSKKEDSKEGPSPRISKKEDSKEGSSPKISKKEESKEGSRRLSKKEDDSKPASRRASADESSKEGSRRSSRKDESPRVSKKEVPKDESPRVSKKEVPKDESRRVSKKEVPKDESPRVSKKEVPKDESPRVSKKEVPRDEATRPKKEDSKEDSRRGSTRIEDAKDEIAERSKKDEVDASREESRQAPKSQDTNEPTRPSSRKEDSETQRRDQTSKRESKELHPKESKSVTKVLTDEETPVEQVGAIETPPTKQKDEDDKRTRVSDKAEPREKLSERHVRLEQESSSDREAPPSWAIRTDSELDSEHSESTKSMISREHGLPPKSRRRRSGQLATTENDPPKERHDRQETERQLSAKLRDDTLSSDDQRHYTPHHSATSRSREFTPGPRDRGKKPSFCMKLTDRTATEASRIKLTCTVLGDPEPGVYWTKDGRELPSSSNRHRTIEEYGMCSLELYAALPKDSGEYSCVAQNLHGLAHTEAKLKVYAGYEPLPSRPTFTRSIRDTYRTAENELVLECRVRGQPSPKITWLKDGQVLEIGDRCQQSDLGDGICRLKISRPDLYDSGLYSCRAENDSKIGDCTSHVVNFHGKDGTEHGARWRGSYRSLTSCDRDVGRPRFASYLTDHSVPAGGTIALQVEVKGVPQPDITWMRGDKREPISVRKARTFADAGVYTLVVPEATGSETGTYVCRASNAYGFVDTSANVEVVPSCPGDGGKPAMFVSRPAETVIHVTVGEDVSVSFRVSGVPKPRIVWMKGLRDITNGSRSYKESSDDYVRLTLKRAAIEDEGTYCIMAKNRYGCDRTFYTVKVKQRARSLTPSPDWGSLDTDNLLTTIHDTERSYLKQVPGAITSEPMVVDGGRNWLALSWGKAVQHGPAPVVAYRVDAWLLGGDGGARWAELGITPVNAFDAFNLRPGGEYKFRVTPRNRYGWGETVTMRNSVTMREVAKFPEFTKILPGQLKALRGETLRLECEIRSESRADVKWYRDTTDVETIRDPRYMTHYHGLKSTMMIQSMKENDAGRYVCEATNPAGRVSTFARVQVVTDPKIVEADDKLRRMRTLEPSNEERPPEFTMRLRDRRVQMTYPVRLTCQVSGHPEPEVGWYKNREKIYPDDNISFWDDESHFHTLEISHSSVEDSGIYMAKARNLNGSVSCRCHLVVDKGIRAYVGPEFLRHLDAVYTVKLDGELRMTAQIEAYPTVGIVWHRDGHRLRPSRSTVMTLNHDGSVELSLAHVTPRDAGLYCCTATNEVGRAESTTRVTVIGSMDEEISSISQSLPDVVESLDVPYSKEPVFVTKPLSTEAFEGDTVIILCEVIGDPKPEVIWLRDFLRPDYYRDAPHFRRVGAGPQFRLEIPYAKLDFTGAYTVIAKNCHGEAKAIISLQIYARGQGRSDSGMEHTSIKHGKVQTLPSVKQPLRDLRCCDGDAVTLICRVHATPEPDVRWEKSGKLVPLGEDFAADFDGETARLSIQHVYPEDEGEYTCVAYNDLGKAFTSACLIVDVPEGKESALSGRLIRPIGLLSGESTPISTPGSTPIRGLSPGCVTTSRREPKPATRPPRSRFTLARRPRLPTGPKFYAVPHNRVAEEGETVRFRCAIAGHPTPWTIWDKDGVPVTPTTRISLVERDDARILEIAAINHEDAGLYRITLENDVGRTEATARLEIIGGRRGSLARTVRTRSASPRTCPAHGRSPISSAIRGDAHLRPYAPLEGANTRGGTPSPTLPRWQHRNGKSPADSPDPARRQNDRTRTTRKNGAKRTPRPKVPTATKIRSSSVPRRRPKRDETPVDAAKSTTKSPPPRPTNEGNERSRKVSRTTARATNGSMIPKRIGNVSGSRSLEAPETLVETGSPRELRNLATESPREHRDHGKSGESREMLRIPEKKMVAVKNDDTIELAGREVRNDESPDAMMPNRTENSRFVVENARGPRPPVILAAPADVVALRGTKVMLLATFDGEPQPRVRWLRKGRDVRLDDKAEIETSRGLTCLTLEGVTTEQTGKYAVTLENIAGRDCRYVDLTVEGVPDPPAGKPCVQSITRSGKAIVTWRSPSYDGGCAVTGYSVEMKRSEDPLWIAVAEARHSLSHTVTGLEAENTYSFRVRAENAHGLSEPGDTSDLVIVPGENDEETGTRVFTAEINQIEIEEEEEEFEPTFEARIVSPEDGSLFVERYEVKEELGKGRYGLVRRIVEISSGLNLAAKFVRTIKAKDRQQAHEEIDIMNRLRHPKLLRLAAAFENPKEMIMITEYISGGELFERVVADDFTLTEKDSILFVKQICEGVEYMHGQYIVHLDLKPENIMCHTRTSHRIKLIDFGLAQTLKPDTPVRVLFGTPEFIPPEIIGFEPIGTESDMWSVGVICYVLLTGLSPFMGDNDAETFANITRADYDFDDKAFTAISAEAKDFISALLIKRKELRMSAKQCLEHPWLAQQAECMSRVALPTDKLKKFIVRRKWQKTGNAIRALGRMATLSANSRRNLSAASSPTKSSMDDELFGEVITGNGGEAFRPIRPVVTVEDRRLSDDLEERSSEEAETRIRNDEEEDAAVLRDDREDVTEPEVEALDELGRRETDDFQNGEENYLSVTELEDDARDVEAAESEDNSPLIREIDDIIGRDESNNESSPTETAIQEITNDLCSAMEIMEETDAKVSRDTFLEEATRKQSFSSFVNLEITEAGTVETRDENARQTEDREDIESNESLHEEKNGQADEEYEAEEKTRNFASKVPATINIFEEEAREATSETPVVTRVWCKTGNSMLGDEEDENARLTAVGGGLGRTPRPFVRTGSVSRTAKMFEKVDETNSTSLIRQQLNPLNRTAPISTETRPQNERIRKAFAFWNK